MAPPIRATLMARPWGIETTELSALTACIPSGCMAENAKSSHKKTALTERGFC